MLQRGIEFPQFPQKESKTARNYKMLLIKKVIWKYTWPKKKKKRKCILYVTVWISVIFWAQFAHFISKQSKLFLQKS